MKKALRKAAGSLNLYLLVTRTPPITVAALLANVNCKKISQKNITEIMLMTNSLHVYVWKRKAWD